MRLFVRTWFQRFYTAFLNPDLLAKARLEAFPRAFTRQRKLNFPGTVLTILDVGRESSSLKLHRMSDYFKKPGEKMEVTQQAFSKARNQISEYPLRTLFEQQIEDEYHGLMGRLPARSDDGWTYLAVDGTKIALPNLPELREKYFLIGANASSPTALGSCLYDISNNRLIDAAFSSEYDERSCAISHMKRYEELRPGDKKSMFIFDRGYPSIALIREFEKRGMTYLMRCRTKFNCEIDALPLGCDATVTIEGSAIRVIKFELGPGQVETLITNDTGHKTEDFKRLYFMRWGVECSYLLLKNRFQLENFTGKTENTLKQDFWATILASTMLMVLEEDVDEQIRKEREDKGNRYEYQVNRNKFVGIMRDDLIYALTAKTPKTLTLRMNKIIQRAEKFVCPIKPGRTVSRAENKRKTKFHHNHKSNC
ncbi:MAG: transposase [Sphaerochaeta sp.]|uniref:transposase n=1 Tax=Sphaerochaeta sp. TaxID=1972642 RepID=UPI003D108B83